MGDLLKKNEELLNEWEKLCKKKEAQTIVKDGILFRGNISCPGGYWEREETYNEDHLWLNLPLKIMFLMKDFTNDSMSDIRSETLRKNCIGINDDPIKRDAFSMNTIYWLYGLTHLYEEQTIPFSAIIDGYKCFLYYEKYPLVRINTKKNHGGTSITNATLGTYLDDQDYANLLSKQLSLFDADIIFCCGGASKIKNFVVSRYINDGWEKINNWMYYNAKYDKLVIDSYHPSVRRSRQWLYEELMRNYLEFLHGHPAFMYKINALMKYEDCDFNGFTYTINSNW